jgi:hypothetical protein
MQPITLQNPGFDPPYLQQGGDKHLHVAQGWRAWWSTETAPSHGGCHHRPEYYEKVIDPETGDRCQAWQTTHATHRAGIRQLVSLPAGATSVRARIKARYYSRADDGRLGELALRLGIAAGRIADGTDPVIQWGDWRGQTDGTDWDGSEWVTLSASLYQVNAGEITLFVESRCRWAVRNNHAFVDDAILEADVAGQPAPIPPAGDDVIALLAEIRDLVREIRDLAQVPLLEKARDQ